VVVATRTIHGVWHRYLFVSPCLMAGSVPADMKADAG
jgi:hypothetical protein